MKTIMSKDDLANHFGPEFMSFFIALVEDAAQRARSFFEERGEKYDRTTGATIMRYTIKTGLTQAAMAEFNDPRHGFNVQQVRNLAIWFEYDGLRIRGYTVKHGKLPIRGKDCPDHRTRHFSNVEPEQKTLFAGKWLANVSILWSFDHEGNLMGLRAVVGDGWDDAGQLKLALDLQLPTTAVEFRAQTGIGNFTPTEDDEPLLPQPHAEGDRTSLTRQE